MVDSHFATNEQVASWFNEFPCLSKRNFYVIQNHHASADHYDLRLQLDNATKSWVIPKGLSDPSGQKVRMGIETDAHKINYTLVEGSVAMGKSTTGCWDLGTYSIYSTKRTERRLDTIRAMGLSNAESTTNEEESLDPEDVQQEDLFRDAYYYFNFLPTPAVPGRAGLPQLNYDRRSRGFVVELHGERFRGLRLTFSHPSDDFKTSYAQGSLTAQTYRLSRIQFSSKTGRRAALAATEVTSFGDRSLLTNRTMKEIRRDSIAWLLQLLKKTIDAAEFKCDTAETRVKLKKALARMEQGIDNKRPRADAELLACWAKQILLRDVKAGERLPKGVEKALDGWEVWERE